MVAIIDAQQSELESLCRKHHVRRLEVFGSAADGSFDPAKSDLDFLVEYERLSPGEHYETYFGLWEDLAALFGRKIDLIEPHTMRNPYFIRAVNESRKVIYEAIGDMEGRAGGTLREEPSVSTLGTGRLSCLFLPLLDPATASPGPRGGEVRVRSLPSDESLGYFQIPLRGMPGRMNLRLGFQGW